MIRSSVSLSDTELAIRCKDESFQSFAELSKRYNSLIDFKARRYASICGVDLDDFVQEGMIALYKAVKGFDKSAGTQFNTYAITCIDNAMSSAIKAFYKSLSPTHEFSLSLDLDEVQAMTEKSPRTHPEDLYILKETNANLKVLIKSLLSGFEWHVLKLYLGGNSYLEISELLQSSTKAVDNALQRIRRKLRPALVA